MRRFDKRVLGSLIAGIVVSGSAFAELEEITVTAQRREQNLQSVPISVTALTGNMMKDSGISGVTGIGQLTPGMQISRQRDALTVNIRGVGVSSTAPGNESSVATYVDGFYRPQLAGLDVSFNNVERVEILRGPQGTLFGRNATGGLLNVVTRKPQHETSADVSLNYGRFDTVSGNGYATTGITETLAADIAIYGYNRGNGWGTNVTTGEDTYQREEYSGRISFLWTPSDATEVRLALDAYRRIGSEGSEGQPWENARLTTGQGQLSDPFGVYADWPNIVDVNQEGADLRIQHDFDFGRFVSMTGMRNNRSDGQLDQDRTALPATNVWLTDDTENWSQEFQLMSNADSKVDWIVGYYYFDYDSGFMPLQFGHLTGPTAAALGGSTFATRVQRFNELTSKAHSLYAQTTFPIRDDTRITLGARYNREERTFEPNEIRIRQSNLAGQRITSTPASLAECLALGTAIAPGVNCANPITFLAGGQPKKTYKEPTWRVALDHDFTDNIMGYLSYNRGFKSGTYNATTANNPPVKPEILDAYSLGVKSTLMDGKLQINAEAFYYKYKDMQVQVVVQGNTFIQNAAKSKIQGGEIEIVAAPTDNLTLSASLAFADSEYESFPGAQITTPKLPGGNYACFNGQAAPSASCPATGGGVPIWSVLSKQDIAGNDVVRTPSFTGNFQVNYSIPTSYGEWQLTGNWFHSDKFYWEPDNRVTQPSYDLLNAQVKWTHPSEKFAVRVFGTNLGDEEYLSYMSGGSAGDNGNWAAPREYGIGVDVKL